MIKKKEKEESKPILFRQDQSLFDPWGEGVKEFFLEGSHDFKVTKGGSIVANKVLRGYYG